MAIVKIGQKAGIVAYKGRFEDKTDTTRVLMSLALTADQRLDAVAGVTLFHHQVKGHDLDARRLDRSVQVVRRKWR